jgi:microsomal dipeptidase-like Zn-dependent dipeptidase
VKFSERGEIVLVVECSPADDERTLLHIEVRDQGIGIASEHLPQLFTLFHQVDGSSRRRYGGNGIGLILCKRWLLSPEECHNSGADGLHDLIEVMRYVRDLTGDVSVIGIGTDFDGLTHPFTDCCKPDELGRLAYHMRKHFTPREIDDILWGNSLRVFERGWV